jgi:hypothetical protein
MPKRRRSNVPRRCRSCRLELPRNVKLGQVRRTVGIVTPCDWNKLSRDEREAVDALALHVWWRCRQTGRPALEGEDCVFLTVRHVQRLLRAIGAGKTGEKAAAAALATMQERGWIEDTGTTKKPRRSDRSRSRAERYGDPAGPEGGKKAQPSTQPSYWWRVFRVPLLTAVVAGSRPWRGAYARFHAVPHHLASLSALLKRQGLISRPRRRSRPNPGSVQWVFLQSGPP